MTAFAGRQVLTQFWLLVRGGTSREEAATKGGYKGKAGLRRFRQACGVVSTYVISKLTGRSLSFREREEILAGLERGDSIRLIARSLGRAPSTVQRELRRNMWHQLYRARHPRAAPWLGGQEPVDLSAEPGASQSRANGAAAKASQTQDQEFAPPSRSGQTHI